MIENLKHAARNQETVRIGGGDFGPAELRAAAMKLAAFDDILRALHGATELLISLRETEAGTKTIADHSPCWFGVGHCTAAIAKATGVTS